MNDQIALMNISGPYGAGKDSILNAILLWRGSKCRRVSTLTTRPSNSSVDPSYRSVSAEEFLDTTSSDNWAITRQIGGKVLYGTSLTEIEEISAAGRVAVHSIYPSDEGAGRLRREYGRRLLSIGVLPTVGDHEAQIEELRNRLVARGRDDLSVIEARLHHQASAIDYVLDNPLVDTPDGPMQVFDAVVFNDNLAVAQNEVGTLWLQRVEPTLTFEPRSDLDIWLSANERLGVGGGYYNPATDLESTGTPIDNPASADEVGTMNLTHEGDATFVIARLFKSLTQALVPNELLFGLYKRERYALAPYIFDEERLLNFEEQVASGSLQRVLYRALDRETADIGLRRDGTEV